MPGKYRVFAKNLDDNNFAAPSLDEEYDICYLDVVHGRFIFHPDNQPYGVHITCWYNNVLSGGFTSENILHNELIAVDGTNENKKMSVSEKFMDIDNKLNEVLILPDNINLITIEENKNGFSAGDVQINDGKVVNVLDTASWTIL